jgi:hypothetical protein
MTAGEEVELPPAELLSKFTNPELIPASSPRDKVCVTRMLEKVRKNAQAPEFRNLSPRFGPWGLLVFRIKRRLAILRRD